VSGLVDLRVSEPSQLEFSPHELLARLETAKQSNLREELSTLITPGDSLRSNYLENKIEKLNDLPPGSVKLSYSKKVYKCTCSESTQISCCYQCILIEMN